MVNDEIALLIVLMVALLLWGDAARRYVEASSLEVELKKELTHLWDREGDSANCLQQPGCEQATWRLTLETKEDDVKRALVAVANDQFTAKYEAVMTLVGVIFLFWLFRGLRLALGKQFSGVRNRGFRPRRQPG